MLTRLLLLILIAVIISLVSISTGEVHISPEVVTKALFSPDSLSASQAPFRDIIWHLRLPRLLVALAVGGALSVSGYILQALSRNQLADPYLTGVSSGAGLLVAIAMSTGIGLGLIPIFAFAGGLLASILVAFLSRGPMGLSVTRLLLAGIALSTICSGMMTLIITNGSDPVRAQGIFFWLAGSISGRTWTEMLNVSVYTTIGLVATLVMSKQVRLLSLGKQHAEALGADVERSQWILLAIAVMMCGAAVSVSGIVAFVGLVAPHITRRLFERDERIQTLGCALVGMILVAVSDLAARTLVSGQELPLGTLMSLIGGPFFLYLVSRHRGQDW